MELKIASINVLSVLPILFALTFLIKKCLRPNTEDPNLPPGPKLLPIIGNLHHLLGELPHHALCRLAQRYGPLMRLRLGQVDFVVASSPEAAREIMVTHEADFLDRPQLIAAKTVLYGGTDIAFSPYGERWRQYRRISAMELLSTRRVMSFSSHRREEILRLISDIKAAPLVNLSTRLAILTNTITARSAFGKKSEHSQRFISALNTAVKLASGFCIADLFPDVMYIDVVTGMKMRLKRIHRQIDEILEQIMEEHRAKKPRTASSQEGGEEDDVLDVLLRIKDSSDLEIPLTDDNIKAVIADLFAGGTETSSRVLEWTMAELMKNPECMEKAQAELRQVFKGKASINESDLKELHYLKLVIKETIRLHPPLPLLLPRQCTKTSRLQGYKVNAGTQVIINAWALARDPKYWNDAERFDPERFNNSSVDFNGRDFKFLPFGAGRRICPGITFGLATVDIILAHLLFYFNWELPDGMEPADLDMTECFGVTVGMKSELCLVASPYVP